MIKFSNDIPIYLQIMDLIMKDIISGKYLPGKQIPSVRDLAILYSANPNTCQKAVSELAELGLLVSCSTNGKFVTENVSLLENYKKDLVNDLIEKFYNEIEAFGLTKKEILKIMESRGENGDN